MKDVDDATVVINRAGLDGLDDTAVIVGVPDATDAIAVDIERFTGLGERERDLWPYQHHHDHHHWVRKSLVDLWSTATMVCCLIRLVV